MIAKRVPNTKGTSDFARLGRYVVDAQGRIDPRTWTRTADYILDTAHEGAKVGGVRVTNCAADEPAAATLEILATQALNKRSRGDKTYHLVVSFPPGERPPLEVLHAIEDRLCEAIGLSDHQRLSAVHTDTAHLHMHIAINKVHPQTFRMVEPYYDKARLMTACEVLEVEYDLQRTNHGQTRGHQAEERQNDRNADVYEQAAGNAHHAGHAAALRQSYADGVAEAPEAETLDSVRDLSGLGLDDYAQGSQVLLQADAPGDLADGATQRNDSMRRPGDGAGSARGGGSQSVAMDGRAPDMEAHSGRESLLGWIKREAAPALEAAGNWQALHRELALHGLVIKPRAAGLVIGTQDGALAVKASQIKRSFSLDALTRRFGPFEPAAPNVVDIRAAKLYRQNPRHSSGSTPALFAEFQRARDAALKARKEGRDQLRAAHGQYVKDLATYYKRRRDVIARGPLRGLARRAAFRALALERETDLRKRRALEAQQRAAIGAQNALPVWQAWLMKQADAGDERALAALRSRERKEHQFAADWLRAGDADAAKHLVLAHLQPRTDKHGTVRYQVGDGGTVADTQDGVRVDQRTEAASFLALLLAADKYRDQALIVDGSDRFREEVARLAGAKGLEVTFQDANLEHLRRVARPAPATPVSGTALDTFVQARNAQRQKVPNILPHRAWRASDAGASVYQGRRKLADGTEALLLERSGEMLVLPASAAQAAKASTWSMGSAINVDGQGRLTTPASRRRR